MMRVGGGVAGITVIDGIPRTFLFCFVNVGVAGERIQYSACEYVFRAQLDARPK
jgi:hypothetical protein